MLHHKSIILCLVHVWLCQIAVAETNIELSPDNFSHTATVNLSNPDAVIVTVPLPRWSYLASKHQLLDLRVFNAEGIAVAHQLSPLTQEAQSKEFSVNIAAIPLAVSDKQELGRSADIKLDLKGKVDIHLSEQPNNANTAAPTKVDQLILNDPKLSETTLNRLRFEITDAQKTDFVADVSIETSDDLRTWHALISNQKLLNYGKQHLTQLAVTVPASKARYWRVKSSGEDISRIAKVYASAVPNMQARSESLTVDCRLNTNNDKLICPFQNSSLPLTSVQFDFGQQHVAFNAQISTYEKMPQFEDIKVKLPRPAQTINLMLTNQQSNEIDLNGSVATALVVTTQQGGKLSIITPVKLTIKWSAQQLKFLINGSAPFTLAVGAENLKANAEQFIDSQGVVSGGVITDPLLKQAKTVAEQTEIKHPWLLWGLLSLAVLSLGWMAISLLKQK